MRFITIIIFAVAGRLIALAVAKPIPNQKAGGIAISLTRHSSSLSSNRSIDLDAITSQAISVRDKIFRGLDNYEMNTGTMHPLAVKRSESELGRRGNGLPLFTMPHRGNFWAGEISIGTPPQELMVMIDTGSAETWVLQTGCHGVSSDRELWDPQSSATSAHHEGPPFQLSYDDNTIVEGNRYTDNVTIAEFTADPQIFGSITSYTSPIPEHGYLDGILGLAFSSISGLGVDSLFESLVKQNRLTEPVFSLKLTFSEAELYIGGANSELYNGDITYIRVTTPAYWEVSMDDLTVDGRKILENLSVIFDSGSSFIFGDWNLVSDFYRVIGGTLKERGDFGYYYLPCNSFPKVVFTLDGTPFPIHPQVLNVGPIEEGSPNCFGAIVAHRAYTDRGFWTFGQVVLESVYTVFDYGRLRIGFAELA